MDSNTTYNEMMAAEGNLKQYEDPNLTTNINKNVMSQWSPLLKNSAQATQDKMSSFLKDFSNIGYGALEGGTGAADLSPHQKMQMMGAGLGEMAGSLNYSSSLSSILGGKASEMSNRAIQAMQHGNQTAANSYNRASQRYQLAIQEEERKKAAAAEVAYRQQMMNQQSGRADDLILETNDTPTFVNQQGQQQEYRLGDDGMYRSWAPGQFDRGASAGRAAMSSNPFVRSANRFDSALGQDNIISSVLKGYGGIPNAIKNLFGF